MAPRRVADEVWDVEVAKWRPDLDVRVLTDVGPTKRFPRAADRREHMLRKEVDAAVTVVTRDQVACMGTRVHPYRTLVLDELSGYKNKRTGRWKSTRDVLRAGERQGTQAWGLTGTPAPNGYHDLYGQVFMLDKGRRLGDTLEKYRDRYFYAIPHPNPMVNAVIGYELKPGAERSVNALLEDLCVSMKKEDYLKDLPGLHFNEVKVPMPPGARKIYRDLEEDLVVDLTLLGGEGALHTAGTAAILSNRLRQAAAGFLYFDQDTSRHTRIHDAKTEALMEIQDGTGDNVLAFYAFEEERRRILERVPGAVSIDERGAVKAWDRGEIRMLVAHPASAGHGLNLQHGGSTQVWTSLTWSLEWWEQGVGRTHRQGQGSDVVVHWLNSSPMDPYVFAALQKKQSVEDAFMAYLRERHLFL